MALQTQLGGGGDVPAVWQERGTPKEGFTSIYIIEGSSSQISDMLYWSILFVADWTDVLNNLSISINRFLATEKISTYQYFTVLQDQNILLLTSARHYLVIFDQYLSRYLSDICNKCLSDEQVAQSITEIRNVSTYT